MILMFPKRPHVTIDEWSEMREMMAKAVGRKNPGFAAALRSMNL